MAMCIVHEFGHCAVQWQTKKPTSPIASSSNTVNTHVTPNIFKEAGRYVEKKLFGSTIGIVCNKDHEHPKIRTWEKSLQIAGIVLDKCDHDRYLCEECEQNNHDKRHCTDSFCDCLTPVRYRFISQDFINNVANKINTYSDQELEQQLKVCGTTNIPQENQLIFKVNCKAKGDEEGSDVKEEEDEEGARNVDDEKKEPDDGVEIGGGLLVFKTCGTK